MFLQLLAFWGLFVCLFLFLTFISYILTGSIWGFNEKCLIDHHTRHANFQHTNTIRKYTINTTHIKYCKKKTEVILS